MQSSYHFLFQQSGASHALKTPLAYSLESRNIYITCPCISMTDFPSMKSVAYITIAWLPVIFSINQNTSKQGIFLKLRWLIDCGSSDCELNKKSRQFSERHDLSSRWFIQGSYNDFRLLHPILLAFSLSQHSMRPHHRVSWSHSSIPPLNVIYQSQIKPQLAYLK